MRSPERGRTSPQRFGLGSRREKRSPRKETICTVINRHRVVGTVSQRKGLSDEETASLIEEWLRIPSLPLETEEEIAGRNPREDACSDEAFPPAEASLGESDPQLQIEWRRLQGTMYLPELHAVKITKGIKSPTWFVGALAAVACRQDLLLDLIVSDDFAASGLYTFQFYKHGIWQQVVVDDALPFNVAEDVPLFSASSYEGELWPSLLEKAYAKVHGSYKALERGSVEDALVDLTGGSAFVVDLSEAQWQAEASNGELWAKLIQYSSWGYIIACAIEVPGAAPGAAGPGQLLMNHAYSVLDVRQTSGGLQLLRVHNPWVGGDWCGAWADDSPEWTKPEHAGLAEELGYEFEDDGGFWMSFWDFVGSFNTMYVARLFPPSWHQLTLHSGWLEGTAGGPPGGMYDDHRLSSTWCSNPQFRVTVRKPAELLLCLSQRDPQIVYGGHVPEEDREVHFGCAVLEDGADETARRWTFDPEEALAVLGPTGARDVTASLKITPDHSYLVIPFTSVPFQPGAFVIRTFSSAPLEIEQLPSPMQLQVADQWKAWTAGGSREHCSWGSNPQFLLTCPQRTTILLSVTRIDGKSTSEESENISLILTRAREAEDGLARALTISRDNEIAFEASEDSPEHCTALVPIEPEMPYVLTPSTKEPGVEGEFQISVVGSAPVEIIKFPEVMSITLSGAWNEETAGGCDLNPMWKKNPKFLLTPLSVGSHRVTLKRLGNIWKKGTSIDRMLGYYVLKADNSAGDISDFKEAIVAEAPFLPLDLVEQDYVLHPGLHYVIMPCIYAPGKTGNFTVSVTAKTYFEFQAIDEFAMPEPQMLSPLQ